MIKKYIPFALVLLAAYPARAEFSFREKFVELSQKSGNLDKNDLRLLKKLAEHPEIEDPEFAKDTIENLGKYKTRTKLEYTIFEPVTHKEEVLTFVITPTYSETEKIPGKNAREVIANISQRDSLNETVGDGDRCAAASVLNSYLLMGGKFSNLAKKHSIGTELTYRNVHLLQEKLYNYGNTDKSPGIYSGFKYSYYKTGEISNIRASGEIVELAKSANLTVVPILGKDLPNIHKRKEQVLSFLNNNPRSTVQAGVYLDLGTGNISRPINDSYQNHVITIFKYNNALYYSDTGNVDNGDGMNVKKMTNTEMEQLVFNTPGIVMGLTMN